MTDKARTKEEIYILKIDEMARASGDPFQILDRYAIGSAVGFSYRVVNAICNTLLQANFLKKTSDASICLTVRGIELAQRLKEEK
jgi:predicted transcriptional regulator